MCFDDFEKVRDFVFRCKTCGEEVPAGIINITGHWTSCTGKGFYEGLMSAAAEKKGRLSLSDIDELHERFLKTNDE